MALPVALESLKAEALQTSCAAWAIRARWKLVKATATELVGPCPVCGGTDRFAINTRTDLWNCRQCGGRGHGVINLVMFADGVSFTRACEIITGRTAEVPQDEAKMAALRDKAQADEARRQADAERRRANAIAGGHELWTDLQTTVPVRGGPVQLYLEKRGLNLADHPGLRGQASLCLRENWAMPYWTERGDRMTIIHAGPAMLAAVQAPDDRFIGAHITWIDLSRDNGKLMPGTDAKGEPLPAKKVKGSQKGGAIRLYTPRGARRMVVGEGIETTLTAFAHNFEPDTAYWTGVNLNNLAGPARRGPDGTALHDEPDLVEADCFVVPDWVEEVIFLSDDDDARNHTEAKVVRGLKRALWQRDRRRAADTSLPPLAGWYMPPLGGGRDLNDLVRVK